MKLSPPPHHHPIPMFLKGGGRRPQPRRIDLKQQLYKNKEEELSIKTSDIIERYTLIERHDLSLFFAGDQKQLFNIFLDSITRDDWPTHI
jgi:hypothetical protein